MLERIYQGKLIIELRKRFPGCVILKNDPEYLQGVPDLTILLGTNWGALEVKTDMNAPYQPNQEYYLEQLNEMSFAAMICPQNEEEIFDGLQQALQPERHSCVPKRQ